jgi:hypothetical protein
MDFSTKQLFSPYRNTIGLKFTCKIKTNRYLH